MAKHAISLVQVLRAKADIKAAIARAEAHEAQTVALLDKQLRPLGFRIERIDAPAPPIKGLRAATQLVNMHRKRKTGVFPCPKRCGRTFSMQMHVARHLNTVHAKKK